MPRNHLLPLVAVLLSTLLRAAPDATAFKFDFGADATPAGGTRVAPDLRYTDERGFGFEYQKRMYASALERVGQLRDYLAQVDAGHPLFVWVHLFEPHEPYDPPAELIREDSARGRYDGEVALCDRAIGELVRTFRAARPGGTVIVTADHGEEFGEHGGSYHGTTLFEEQARDGGGSGGGELPVAGELRSVDGYVVRVAFDAERACGQGSSEDRDHGDR